MRKISKILAGLAIFLGFGLIFATGIYGAIEFSSSKTTSVSGSALDSLPAPEITGGIRGQLGIDKNINESNIDQYLDRADSVYRDMRMLVDPASYSNIGGDSYLSGFVRGFEVVPYPKLINVTGLPEAVGQSYTGKTLFTRQADGKIVANYASSMAYLEYYFPKNKNIFLMCGGGGYAGMTKQLLVDLGWDESRIWVVGGYWYYQGQYSITVKRIQNNQTSYDFWKVPYHDINFEEFQ